MSETSQGKPTPSPSLEGRGGCGDDPEILALLDFEPASRKNKRRDGWTPPLQRLFIAELARTGSPTLAAEALGKNRYGIEKIYKGEGAKGFRAAWDAAVALFEEREAAGLVERTTSAPRPPAIDRRRRAPPPQIVQADPKDDQRALFEHSELTLQLIGKYAIKLQQERNCRHAGKIAEADFYLRQATWFEVAIDLTTPSLVGAFEEVNRDGHDLFSIADTPASRVLDNVRRKYWEMAGEPERPPRPEHLLVDHGSCRTEPLGQTRAPSWEDPEEWERLALNEQFRRYEEQYARDAAAYEDWLERAYADAEARRLNSSLSLRGEGTVRRMVEGARGRGKLISRGGAESKTTEGQPNPIDVTESKMTEGKFSS
jgi:hypothetical protein